MATTIASVPRKLDSWIESFERHSAHIQSPPIFRRWAGVVTIAGALERKVWARTSLSKDNLYPNLFVVLVGGPGIGKTQAIRETEFFWRSLNGLCVAPDSVTRASLVDDLFAAKRRILRPADNPPFSEFHSLQCPAEEFGIFIPQYEGEFINTLNKLYDCGKQFSESRRGNKGEPKRFPNPQLNIIGGTTPSYLKDSLPEGAWSQGFTSRIILVYSGERIIGDPWINRGGDEALEAALISDLQVIFNAYGEVIFSPEAAEAFRNWYLAGGPPAPEHPRLEHYIPRRHIHLLKICMIFSLSRSNDLVVTIEDYQSALDLLLEAEAYMPDTFKAMTMTEHGNVIDEAYRFLWEIYAREKKDVSEHRLVYYMSQRVPAHAVAATIENMINSQIIAVTVDAIRGRRMLRPKSR